LGIDVEGKLYGWGKCNDGQLGFKPKKGVKSQTKPLEITFDKPVK
jgi:alpha-tubulin suppressor-like RCC1 family protein